MLFLVVFEVLSDGTSPGGCGWGCGLSRVKSTNLCLRVCTWKVLKMSWLRWGDQVLDQGLAEWWLFWIHSEHKHVFNIILPLMENSLCVYSLMDIYAIRVCALMVCVLACVFVSSYMQNILK